MNKNAKDLISLIKMLLTKNYVMLEDPNYSEIYKIAKYHSIQNMLYYAIMEYKEKFSLTSTIDPTLLKQLSTDNKNALAKAAYQEEEKEAIFKKLEEAKIDYMPMKGSIIKYLYPSIDMRSMADLDIYFDATKSKIVKNIMLDLGYSLDLSNIDQDIYKKIPFMNVEMHKNLASESFVVGRYFKDYWPRLEKVKENGQEYQFNINDYYIFMVSHNAIDFSIAGMGIRRVIDEFIYLSKYRNELDYDYIEKELNNIELAKFESNLRKLAMYWFDDQVLNEDDTKLMEEMVDYIIKSGTYGTIEHNILNKLMGEGVSDDINASKVKYILRRLFPSVSFMKERNPILKKVIILLPWFYFIRLCKGIFSKKKSAKNEYKATTRFDKNKYEKNQKMHDDIGA